MRYLTDVTLTVEVECDGPEGIEAAVKNELDAVLWLEVKSYKLDDYFTVVGP